MHPLVALLIDGLALYAAIGTFIALAFVTIGVTRVLPDPAPVSLGARLLLIPGSVVLWPYVVARWIKARGTR